MKFSVLLPTRNRLEYLKYAIASVIQQDYNDWEIIVSDNYSEEDIQSYITSLDDFRIKYFRTQSFCPVTENWNNALEKSVGDYVIMLGDDDCLLQGYFKTCLRLLQQNNFPDMIYSSALIYYYPNVMPGAPLGYLIKAVYAPFLLEKRTPFILEKQETLRLVRELLNFTVIVNFNMQHSLISRALVWEIKKYGPFYQSPYPDYYATTALMIKAQRILAVPYPMVVIGVTPKSFGYYYCNNKEKQGVEMLQNISNAGVYGNAEKFVIPGTDMNISWLFAMETIWENFHKEYTLKVNYKKFRLLQVLHNFKQFACLEGVKLHDLLNLARKLFWWEKIAYVIPFFIALAIRLYPGSRRRPWIARKALVFSHPFLGPAKKMTGQYNNILEVFKDVPIVEE